MERNVEIDKISDGKRYGANDLVKVGCDDCRGCSACCNGMGDSILSSPVLRSGKVLRISTFPLIFY